MKTLKFAPELASLVLDGSKTSTWRLFDDKDLAQGDQLSLVNRETREEFAKAVIIWPKHTT
ncbi:MAG: ASCH domain-containing protein [Candidatus Blackburnbacteria bacterium]|nr:ASCH domain-containing protein [Candidatus Blackburnbacteria bacterium]